MLFVANSSAEFRLNRGIPLSPRSTSSGRWRTSEPLLQFKPTRPEAGLHHLEDHATACSPLKATDAQLLAKNTPASRLSQKPRPVA